MEFLRDIVRRNRAGEAVALPSVCSANPEVLVASLRQAERLGLPVLIEATSNQVNQFGGYTGMQPAGFRDFVLGIAAQHGVDARRIQFGGDHLGPQAWRGEPAEAAMAKARDLVAAYAAAGFSKIHLDCSEACAGDPEPVGDDLSAARAAELAVVAEQSAQGDEAISYIVGTEVPPPGGARANHAGVILPTAPQSARATIAAHEAAFAAAGVEASAWRRTVALVVQPGLEFGPESIDRFDPTAPDNLSAVLADHPGLAFEAHSTDYQHADVFPALARRHFAILKVGPALTFAYRRALYALDALAVWLGAPEAGRLVAALETAMLARPGYWQGHYRGDDAALKLLRHFSYADRIRYYWPVPEVAAAVAALSAALDGASPPETLVGQFFGEPVRERAAQLGSDLSWHRRLVHAEIEAALDPYLVCLRA